MGFLTPILTPIVNSLLVPIKRHLGFLVSSSKKVRYMHAELKKLESAAVDMRTRQESNDENRLAVPDRVPSWLAEVGTIKEQAQTIPTGEVRCCFNMKARYNAGKRSSDILEDIDRLMNEQRSDIKWTNEPKPLGKVSFKKVSTSTVVHEDDTQSRDISSRDPILNDALKSLESNDNKTQMMALTGMGGVGKTTMMEQLKKAAEGRKMFNYIVKVVIGKDRAVVDIQTTIATYIRANLSNADKDTRADELQKKFENISKEGENKILVIFDDVWEKVNFKLCGLSNPLPKGFKLLFTSRDENVCAQMGVDSSLIFKIGVLKDEEAKRLFWKTAQPSSNNDITQDDIRKIGDGIIKVCGGLPLAIAIIASALRDKEKVEWEDAFTRLQKKTLDDYDIKATFEISYKNLKEDDLKAIFILSGLFPEDDYIIIEDLLMYGWGLKFFQNVHTIAEARTQVNTCIKKLMRSNLLIKSDREGCVKMHDLVREYVLSNFSEVKQASIANYNNDSELLKDEESYERILLKCVGMSEFPVDFNHTNLTLLKLIGKSMPLKFPGQFYLRMKSLKVVAFEHMLQPLLPRSLTNLRSLCLISCFLAEDDISFLGDLTNLEVLKLANCHIHMLPSKIGNLKRLKLLDLTGCGGLSIDDGVFENLKKLEELYMRGSPWSTIRFTDVNCRELKMLKLSALEIEFFENRPQPNDVSFEKMKRFRIAMGCQFRNREIDKYSFKNTLNLKTSKTELQNCNILELFKETEILRLEVNDMSYLEEIVFQDSFRNLKALTILNCESLACVFTNSVAKGLLTLERLVIGWCPVLKELWPCEITSSEEEVNNISMLKKIEVWKCKSLVNLFPCNPMRLLSNLKRLEVEECDSIEVLFNIDFGKIEQLRSNSSLRDIEVRDCVRFREVWRIKDAGNNNFNIGSFQAAENISIRKCERFRSILSPTTASYDMRTVKNINIHKRPLQINPILDDQGIPKVGDNNMSVVAFISSSRNFHELKEIELLCVHDVEVMFEIESSNNGVQLPSLEHLKLNSINNLKHVWKCNNWNEWFILQKHQPHSSFQNLTNIRLSDCPSIKYLFPPLIMKLLSNLKEVKLDLCDSMEEIVYSNRENEDEEMMTTTSFPHLDQLNLYKMNNLKHIGGGVAANDTTNYVIHGQSKLDVVHWSLCLFSRQIWIAECNLLMEVFETKDINNININTTFGIPRTTNSIMHKLNNLKTLVIRDCACLEYVFTFSTLESLEKLETLVIRGCKVMKVIVREEYHEVQMLRASSKNMGVVFPALKSIELVDLPNLEGFFLGMNIDFHWPVLDHVKIAYCPQMIAFTSGLSTSPKLKYIHSEIGKHNIPERGLNVMPMLHQTPSSSSECMSMHHTISDEKHWSFHNLLECDLIFGYKDTKIFPSNELQQLQKLETIHAVLNSNVVEVFEVALEVTNNESQTVVEFPKLREIALEYMHNLKYIWKSNEWRRLEFPNLTRLSINRCQSIEYVFTCSMVGCVMQLQELHITWCREMKAVVKEEEEDFDANLSEIIEFPCLKSLKLERLQSLEGFSFVKEDFTFPSLDTLTIELCPNITVFTKGHLVVSQQTVVNTSFGNFPHVGEDINSFIMAKKQEGYII